MGQRSIRFPDDLEAQILTLGDRHDRSFSYIVIREMRRAVESALEDARGSRPGVSGVGRTAHDLAPASSRPSGNRADPERLKELEARGSSVEPVPPPRPTNRADAFRQAGPKRSVRPVPKGKS